MVLSVENTGAPISVPVGIETLGRIMDVLGNPIDECGPIGEKERASIHRKAPSYEELSASDDLLETGIKVIDLVCPFAKGGKVGFFGGAGVGKTVNMMELINNIATEHSRLCRYSPVLVSVLVRVTTSITKCRSQRSLMLRISQLKSGDGLRPDERAAREPLAGCVDGLDHGGEIP